MTAFDPKRTFRMQHQHRAGGGCRELGGNAALDDRVMRELPSCPGGETRNSGLRVNSPAEAVRLFRRLGAHVPGIVA